MSINEIIKNYYQAIKNDKDYVIDEEVLNAFCKEYLELNKLKEKYYDKDINRKELG